MTGSPPTAGVFCPKVGSIGRVVSFWERLMALKLHGRRHGTGHMLFRRSGRTRSRTFEHRPKTLKPGGSCRSNPLLRLKKLVELRWFDGRSGEHGMRLPTMVDLALEEMHEERSHRSVCTRGLRLTRTMPPRRSGVSVCRPRSIACRLQVSKRLTWNRVLPSCRPEPSPLKRVNVE